MFRIILIAVFIFCYGCDTSTSPDIEAGKQTTFPAPTESIIYNVIRDGDDTARVKLDIENACLYYDIAVYQVRGNEYIQYYPTFFIEKDVLKFRADKGCDYIVVLN